MNSISTIGLLVLLCAIGTCDGCSCSCSCDSNGLDATDCSNATHNAIPEDFRAKLKGNWFFAYYSNDVTKSLIKSPDDHCNTVTIGINTGDVLQIDYVYSYPLSGTPSTSYRIVGPRVANEYKWVDTENGFDQSLTLLSITDKYAVFHQQNIYPSNGHIDEWVVVFSKDKTLTADQMDAIEQVKKNNCIAIKLRPAQNFNCKQCTA